MQRTLFADKTIETKKIYWNKCSGCNKDVKHSHELLFTKPNKGGFPQSVQGIFCSECFDKMFKDYNQCEDPNEM
ncbi:MAG: hypothetical protein PHW73_15090 [Atribacterota bacterium]|nr:hypothetical protein [Atribacterota bacterium]